MPPEKNGGQVRTGKSPGSLKSGNGGALINAASFDEITSHHVTKQFGVANMDQGAQGWVIKTARENFWRVSNLCEFEDLIQDGAMVWARVIRRYPNVKDIRNRMALFKTSYTRHIHDLSKKNTALPTNECDLGITLDVLLDIEDPEQNAELPVILSQLPGAIQRALVKLLDPSRANPFRERLDGERETSNARLCRLAGIDPSRDVKRAILAYLAGHQLHPQYE